MADDVTGAVRRTPRPHPRAEDHQTPETGAPVAPGATNTATPASQDAGDGTDDLRRVFKCTRCGADRWVGWRAGPEHEGYPRKAQCVPCGHVQELPPLPPLAGPVVFAGPECDMEAYASLPPCMACEGGGQDTHGTVFEAPLAVHFAAPEVEISGRRRQLCMWCGHVLLDVPLTDGAVHPPWPKASLVRVEDGVATVQPYTVGDPLPPGCCALPDEGEPVCICAVDGHPCPDCRDEDQADEDQCSKPMCQEPSTAFDPFDDKLCAHHLAEAYPAAAAHDEPDEQQAFTDAAGDPEEEARLDAEDAAAAREAESESWPDEEDR